jgi:CheY-like chemotaxis protein
MSNNSDEKKQFLFVDDDPAFLKTVQQLFSEMSAGTWEITTADTHAKAIAALTSHQKDVVVLDIGMPVMDGIQLLRLVGRTNPGQQVVMLTGFATDENRKACLDGGATLFLEKPTTPDGFKSVYAALDALAGAAPRSGFHGVMHRVGLHEVLQMECLGGKSSVLEIFTGKVRGRIYVCDGAVIHAESGSLQGEVALYSLLALRGGEFNLQTFAEPSRRTISGQWEFLLMEAARLRDEGVDFGKGQTAGSGVLGEDQMGGLAGQLVSDLIHIEEVLLCSGTGELLYEWECQSRESRMRLFDQIEENAAQVASLAPVGRFDRLEIVTEGERAVCQIQPDRRLFVRSRSTPLQP